MSPGLRTVTHHSSSPGDLNAKCSVVSAADDTAVCLVFRPDLQSQHPAVGY